MAGERFHILSFIEIYGDYIYFNNKLQIWYLTWYISKLRTQYTVGLIIQKVGPTQYFTIAFVNIWPFVCDTVSNVWVAKQKRLTMLAIIQLKYILHNMSCHRRCISNLSCLRVLHNIMYAKCIKQCLCLQGWSVDDRI